MSKKSFLIVAVLLFSCLCSYILKIEAKKKSSKSNSKSSDTTDNNNADSTKLKKLVSLINNYNVVSLGDSNFTKFVIDRPREYNAFLMFTATGKQYQCSVCVRGKDTMIEVAQLYNSQFDFNSSSPKQRIVFFRIEVDDARTTFSNMQMETVPRIFLLPPTEKKSPKMKLSDFEVDAKFVLEGSSAVLEEINSTLGINILLTVDPKPFIAAVCLLALFVSFLVSSASFDVYNAIFWYQSPNIWIVISAICFGVGVSGSIFCIIRSAPPYGYSKSGLVIFAGQGRDQYLVEGIIVALWTVGCGIIVNLMMWVTKMRRFPLFRHVMVLLCFSTFIVLLLQIWNAYILKTGWYSLKETLPNEVWQFLTSGIKKNSGILKRVSEFWLFESKDFESFKTKFKAIVLDYLNKQVSQLFNNGK